MTELQRRLLDGLVIPAHPLALTRERKLDERRQRALTRYYLASGAGGIAVGVHTTQFAIREREAELFRPVLSMAVEESRGAPVVKIAGVCGLTKQAMDEAEFAASAGYDAALVSLGAFADDPVPVLLGHIRTIAAVLPVAGFYLQECVGGRLLPYEFWRRLVEIDNVVAIKVAPFNRYQTLDVARAVAESGRVREIALYTGNDDSILIDLLSEFDFGGRRVHFAGGLLGHWAVWTQSAVRHLELVKQVRSGAVGVTPEMLTLAHQITDVNGAFFDAANRFHGCIAGIHEVLRRQGLLAGRWCLDPDEDLSPGQAEEIDRVCRLYPHLNDDGFVAAGLDDWLA